MSFSPSTALLLLTLLALVRAQAQQPDALQQAQQARAELQARMKDLVDSVEDAVGEAKEASKNREVVDLGQSLHLLETKFAGLRSALSAQVDEKSKNIKSHSTISQEITKGSASLVNQLAKQRNELTQLVSDLDHVDISVHDLLGNLDDFDVDMVKLNKVVKDLHINHEEIEYDHKDTHSIIREITEKSANNSSNSHVFLSVIMLVEMALLVAFLYYKRNASAMKHKAYGKFG